MNEVISQSRENLSENARLMAVETLAFSRDMEVVPILVEIAKTEGRIAEEALRWLVHLSETRWSKLNLAPLLKAHGLTEQEN